SNNGKTANSESISKVEGADKVKTFSMTSIQKFMDFDDIVDNMIVRKGRTQYLMVIECKGINYDLLSEAEKQAVENGFTQFLNTLRFPIQLYVQTRSLNLKEIITEYKDRVNLIASEISDLDIKIKRAKISGNYSNVERLEFEKRRKQNVLDYGNDVANYIERMSSNQNVLKQNTYVVVAYYTSELGGDISTYTKDEIDNLCFSEIYTRTQTVLRSLGSAEVTGRILSSEELAELLYVAYNRDEYELLNLRNEFDAQYDNFYSTAPDIMQKKIASLEKQIEEDAAELAAASLLEADKIKMLERTRPKKIKQRAKEMVSEYKDSIEPGVYEETMNQIENNAEKLLGEDFTESKEEIKKVEKKRKNA
ncbi:MAG: hypothetical protein J6O41_07835, partial [Clostridia bacterium]|nr:hypothetical protein [Clostridia bacterium]